MNDMHVLKNRLFWFILVTTFMQGNAWWFDFIMLPELLKQHPEIKYHKCFDAVPFEYEKFAILPEYPNQGTFWETFVVTIPQGRVQSEYGYIFVDNHFIEELVYADQPEILENVPQISDDQVVKIVGRVAVITLASYYNYCHFLNEVLGRLALLEMNNIAYDWLYVPYDKPFIKEALKLWGIDPAKIIAPTSSTFCIQADELIIPSMVINSDIGFRSSLGVYAHPYTLKYVRNKLLAAVYQNDRQIKFSKKVFISRKDVFIRRMVNEDAVFKILQVYGFERYELSKMSVVDQILLFNNAEIVIGAHGSGFTNIMFCKPNTRVIELFQALIDSAFWYASHLFHLNYTPIQTINFEKNHMTHWPDYMQEYMLAWKANTYVPLSIIHQIVQNL